MEEKNEEDLEQVLVRHVAHRVPAADDPMIVERAAQFVQLEEDDATVVAGIAVGDGGLAEPGARVLVPVGVENVPIYGSELRPEAKHGAFPKAVELAEELFDVLSQLGVGVEHGGAGLLLGRYPVQAQRQEEQSVRVVGAGLAAEVRGHDRNDVLELHRQFAYVVVPHLDMPIFITSLYSYFRFGR